MDLQKRSFNPAENLKFNMMMKIKRPLAISLLTTLLLLVFSSYQLPTRPDPTNGIERVKIRDAFWGPKLEKWRTTTVNDVFNKFDGNYRPQASSSLANDFKE